MHKINIVLFYYAIYLLLNNVSLIFLGSYSFKVMIFQICDIDCYITNVDASYGGATHDAYIWRECDIRSHMESLQNETAYLLGMFVLIIFIK